MDKNKKINIEKQPDVELLVYEHLKNERAKKTRDKIRKRFKEVRGEKEEAIKLAKHAEEKAFTDKLTNLPNLHAYEPKIETEMQHAKRNKKPISLLMIDIDKFKDFNDEHGHKIGDRVLKKVAQTLNEERKREVDMVARYGGEEFVVVLPEANYEDTKNIAERFRLAVENETKDTKYPVTVSIGYATFDLEDKEHIWNEKLSTPDKLKIAADVALYHAKKDGRNLIKSYVDGLEMPTQLEKLIKRLLYIQHQAVKLKRESEIEKRVYERLKKKAEENWQTMKNHEKEELIEEIDYIQEKVEEIVNKMKKLNQQIRDKEEAIGEERRKAA